MFLTFATLDLKLAHGDTIVKSLSIGHMRVTMQRIKKYNILVTIVTVTFVTSHQLAVLLGMLLIVGLSLTEKKTFRFLWAIYYHLRELFRVF